MNFKRLISGSVAVCMMFCSFTSCGNNKKESSKGKENKSVIVAYDTPQDALNAFFDAYSSHDPEKVFAASYPKDIVDTLPGNNNSKYLELTNEYQSNIDALNSLHKDFTIDFSIEGKSKMDETLYEKAQQYFDIIYNAAGISDVPKITDAYYFNVNYYPLSPDETEKNLPHSNNFCIVELNGSTWCSCNNYV